MGVITLFVLQRLGIQVSDRAQFWTLVAFLAAQVVIILAIAAL